MARFFVGQYLSVLRFLDLKYATFECAVSFFFLFLKSDQFEKITITFNQIKIILGGGVAVMKTTMEFFCSSLPVGFARNVGPEFGSDCHLFILPHHTRPP